MVEKSLIAACTDAQRPATQSRRRPTKYSATASAFLLNSLAGKTL
jgi:hypothetical protein